MFSEKFKSDIASGDTKLNNGAESDSSDNSESIAVGSIDLTDAKLGDKHFSNEINYGAEGNS